MEHLALIILMLGLMVYWACNICYIMLTTDGNRCITAEKSTYEQLFQTNSVSFGLEASG